MGVALHHAEVGAHVRRQVDLVDDEQIRPRDARAALARDLLSFRDVDDIDGRVHELRTERGGQVVATALHQQEVERREPSQQAANRFEVDGRVLANRRVRAAAGLDADDALGRQRPAPREELGVFLRIDVVGDHGHVHARSQPQAERLGQRGLPGADGTADPDLERLRDHDRNIRASSSA